MNQMNRRNFLSIAIYGAFIYVASRLPHNNYGAVFRITKVDPDGSGMDYHGHEGSYVYNAQRCCKNCQMVWAAWEPGGNNNELGLGDHELTPINAEARKIIAEINASKELRRNWRDTRTAYAVGW